LELDHDGGRNDLVGTLQMDGGVDDDDAKPVKGRKGKGTKMVKATRGGRRGRQGHLSIPSCSAVSQSFRANALIGCERQIRVHGLYGDGG